MVDDASMILERMFGCQARGRPTGNVAPMTTPATSIEVQAREIRVTNPDKVYFPDAEGGPIT